MDHAFVAKPVPPVGAGAHSAQPPLLLQKCILSLSALSRRQLDLQRQPPGASPDLHRHLVALEHGHELSVGQGPGPVHHFWQLWQR